MIIEIENGKNRRQRERLNLSLPVRVLCRESLTDSWDEASRLIDVTPFGARFALARELEIGQLLQLTTPMPRQLRCYDHIAEQYSVWAVARYIRKSATSFQIGVAFVGKHPPSSYLDNPATLYEVIEPDAVGFWQLRELKAKNDNAGESKDFLENNNLRRFIRHNVPLNLAIELINERGETIASEMTITENVSLTGAMVFTTLKIERGRLVRLSSDQYDVTIIAVVRSRKTGNDGLARLHLEFIDRQFPLQQ